MKFKIQNVLMIDFNAYNFILLFYTTLQNYKDSRIFILIKNF